jgi:hypothetical protein
MLLLIKIKFVDSGNDNMPKFSKTSADRLATCDPKLQEIMNEVVKMYDISVLCGHRGEEAQNNAYKEGASGVQYPDSNHNKVPSRAVDICPYPVDWDNINSFHYMAGIVHAVATQHGYKVRWGGGFTSMFDGPHFELVD